MSDAPARQPTINVEAISKWHGNLVAVNDVSLQVYPGITGLLGPNGAGKTTLLRMISGLSKPSEGSVSVLSTPVRSDVNLYHRVGVMVEQEAVYPHFTGREFVEFSARLHGLDSIAPAVDLAIERVGLEDASRRKLGTYSRGMRQRMRLAAAIVHDPEVLLLDEPLNGTDPRQRLEFQRLMRELAQHGRTILISSHILEEVEVLAENILLMIAGKLAASGDYRAIRAKLNQRPYRVRVVTGDARAMAAALIGMEAIDSVEVDGAGGLVVLSRNVAVLQRSLPRIAQDHNLRLTRVEPLDESLESVFGYLVEA